MRRWKPIVGAGSVLLGYGLLYGGRVILLQRAGRRLVARTQSFPRSFRVGNGRPRRIAFLGDSTAVGVGVERLEATLPYLVASGIGGAVETVNLGISGARLAEVVRDELPRLAPGAWDCVFVSASANDATHGTSADDFERSYRALIEGLRARGARKIVMTTTPDFRNTPALPFFLNRRFNQRAERLTGRMFEVAGHGRVVYADLNREATLVVGDFAEDGFHPNASGYRKWAKLFVRAFFREKAPEAR